MIYVVTNDLVRGHLTGHMCGGRVAGQSLRTEVFSRFLNVYVLADAAA